MRYLKGYKTNWQVRMLHNVKAAQSRQGWKMPEVYRAIADAKEGIAYVDFSGELSADHPSGSEAELATVFAVVNTLAYNYKDVKRVFILIDGTERES